MYRPTQVAVGVAVLHQLVIFAYYPLWATQSPFWVVWLWSLTELTGLVAWGMWIRTRRQLIASLHDQVERAHAEQQLLAEQARRAERTRIAREMHDVVAHRVSLMALHAGALEVRPDLPTAEIRDTAGIIRSTARQALEELRGAIGVLRDRDGGANGEDGAGRAPQPTLRDLPRLVEESRRAGMKIELLMRIEDAESAPGALGRDTYRIVREALTNVSKHARGAATTVTVSGRPGDGLRVTVRNRLPLRRNVEVSLPGARMGLVGLAERVALAGGTLRHGPGPDGDFVVDAALQWAR
jgi:signal transduction histidine kinase